MTNAARQALQAKEQVRAAGEVLAVKSQLPPPALADVYKTQHTGPIVHTSSPLEKADGVSFVDGDLLDWMVLISRKRTVSAQRPFAYDPAEGAVELHAVLLLPGGGGGGQPAGPAALLCSAGGRPPLRLCALAREAPQCKVRLRLERDAVTFTCAGAGEVLITGLLRPHEGAGIAPAASQEVAKPPPVEGRAWDNRAAARAATPAPAAAPAPAAGAGAKRGGAAASSAPAAAPATGGEGDRGGKKRKLGQEDKPAVPVARRQLGSGLEYEVLKAGAGPAAASGKTVQVRYEGRLAKTGQRFDKGMIKFRLGVGEVIRGWDEGVKGMQRGEKRRLLVPPRLGYGASGAPPLIPPHAALVFEVELCQC